jgi:hypothetical protein
MFKLFHYQIDIRAYSVELYEFAYSEPSIPSRFQGKRENDLADSPSGSRNRFFSGSNLRGHRQVPAAMVNFGFRGKSGPRKFRDRRGIQFYCLFAERTL